MKCKVIKGFIDKKTGKGYNVGDEFECKEKRFDEIQSLGNYLVKVQKEPVKK